MGSMLNPFVIRKWSAYMFLGFLPPAALALGALFFSPLIGIIMCFAVMLVAMLISNLLLKNPFSAMLEGQGVLLASFGSTGVWRFFVVQVIQPFIQGRVFGRKFQDVWDRDTVTTLQQPVIATESKCVMKEDGGLELSLSATDVNKNRQGFFHYPMILYNEEIGQAVPKEYFTKLERNAFAQHSVNHLLRQVQKLDMGVDNFKRGVADLFKPKFEIGKSTILWIILIVGVVILGIFFLPKLLGGVSGGIGGLIPGGGAAVTPR